MALRMIKQGKDEKVKIYYERMLKLTNNLQHWANYSLLISFFQIGLWSYIWITTTGMKKDTLFEHKETIITTCEKSMVDTNEYKKITRTTNQLEEGWWRKLDICDL